MQPPHIGMEFSAEDGASVYYNTYAKRRGFGIHRNHIDRSQKNKEIITRRLLVCNKEGHTNLNDKRWVGKFVVRRDV